MCGGGRPLQHDIRRMEGGAELCQEERCLNLASMKSHGSDSVSAENEASATLRLNRLLWAGPFAVLASVVAVLFIRTVAVRLLKPSATFLPLTVDYPLMDTVMFGTAAVLVFLGKCRYSLEPITEYRSLAAKALAVSFLPDVALAVGHWYGGGWPEAFALMTMHVAVWAICVTILPGIVAMKDPEQRRD